MLYINIIIKIAALFILLIGVYLCSTRRKRLLIYTKRTNLFKRYIKTVYNVYISNFNKHKGMKGIEREIYEAISFMRNLITLDNRHQIRGDILIEKLAERKGVLQKVYIKMLGSLRLNNMNEAVEIFKEETGIHSEENEFASLLIQWDEMSPKELSEILISIQRAARERRVTRLKKRDEMLSDLIYLPVVLNVLVIFINFLYISFYLEQQENLINFF